MTRAVVYAAGTWTYTKADRERLEAMGMWIWKRMKNISWIDKTTNEVFARINSDNATQSLQCCKRCAQQSIFCRFAGYPQKINYLKTFATKISRSRLPFLIHVIGEYFVNRQGRLQVSLLNDV